jgi:hypothetical protein
MEPKESNPTSTAVDDKPLDFSLEAWEVDLPPLGRQPAEITDVRIVEKADVTYAEFVFVLKDSSHQVEDFRCIDSDPSTGGVKRAAAGRRMILDICKATGKAPTFASYDDIRSTFIGLALDVMLVKGAAEGMPVAKVTAVLPVKSE